MGVRAVGVVLVLAALGAAGGIGLAQAQDEQPVALDTVAPVVGTGPTYPRDPRVRVLPDPDFPILARGLATKQVRIGIAPYTLTFDVPKGWSRFDSTFGEWRWYPPDWVKNTYFIRVRLIGNQFRTVADALQDRIDDLSGADAVTDFHLDYQSADTFVASYLTAEHRILTMERYIGSDDSPGTAYASLAVIGRMVDRDGMTALLESLTASATSEPPAPTSDGSDSADG
ncbi:MAG: hypothetical protein F2667_08445 [Actinobacteria bacterium]|nr:hypothetical protein [Actinomycetota bacterium]